MISRTYNNNNILEYIINKGLMPYLDIKTITNLSQTNKKLHKLIIEYINLKIENNDIRRWNQLENHCLNLLYKKIQKDPPLKGNNYYYLYMNIEGRLIFAKTSGTKPIVIGETEIGNETVRITKNLIIDRTFSTCYIFTTTDQTDGSYSPNNIEENFEKELIIMDYNNGLEMEKYKIKGKTTEAEKRKSYIGGYINILAKNIATTGFPEYSYIRSKADGQPLKLFHVKEYKINKDEYLLTSEPWLKLNI